MVYCPICKRELKEKFGKIPSVHPSYYLAKGKKGKGKTKKYRYFYCEKDKKAFELSNCLVEFDLETMEVKQAYV